MEPLLAIVLFVIVFVFSLKLLFPNELRGLPPGPRPWPVLGNIPSLGRLVHRATAQLSDKYGGVFTIWLGSVPLVVVTTSELAMQVLRLEDAACSSRPPFLQAVRIITKHKGIVFVPNNDSWRRNRRRALEYAFAPRAMDAWAAARQEEVDSMVAAVRAAVTGRQRQADGNEADSVSSNEQTPANTFGQPPAFESGTGSRGIAQQRAEIQVRPLLFHVALNNVLMMIGRTRYPYPLPAECDTAVESSGITPEQQSDRERGKFVLGMIHRTFQVIGTKNIADFIPWLAPLDPQKILPQATAVSEDLKAYFVGMIRERVEVRRTNKAPAVRRDDSDMSGNDSATGEQAEETGSRSRAQNVGEAPLIDLLLDEGLQEEGEETDEEEIYPILLSMLSAGTDTIAKTAEWALAELVRHPAMMQRASEEVRGRLAGGWAGDWRRMLHRTLDAAKMRDELPFLWATIKETLRHHPAAPMHVPHYTTAAARIGGYTLPPGTMLQVNGWAISHDPRSWPNPHEFDPSRFLQGSGEAGEGGNAGQADGKETAAVEPNGHDFRLLPFGSGRRICAGMSLGVDMVARILVSLLLEFEIGAAGDGEVDLREESKLTMSLAQPLTVSVSLRSSDE